MSTLFRSLMLWLVLLAVPFQGFAAATMLPCASAKASHRQVLATAATHDHNAMTHQHRTAEQAAHDGCDKHGHHAGAKCSTCSTCCIGAAIVSASAPGLAPFAPQSASIPFAPRHLPSVHPPLLERPPSTSLA